MVEAKYDQSMQEGLEQYMFNPSTLTSRMRRRYGVQHEASPISESGLLTDRLSNRGGTFAINGKFTSQRMTGVQRVGYELAVAFQRLLSDQNPVAVMVPAAASAEAYLPHQKIVGRWVKGLFWEQVALPFAARGHTLLSLCNVGPLFARRQVLMIHDAAIFDLPENFSWQFRLWYRVAFFVLTRSALHILTVSAFSKSRIAECLHLDEAQVSIVGNGVDHFDRIESDPSILSKLDLRGDGYVLVVGNLSVGKNLPRMIDVIRRFDANTDFKFVIVGACDARVFNARSEVDSNRIPKNCVMAGFVSDGELKALYKNAACFVFPSLYEGFGLPPLEAMYCGCPVIVSREGALPEVCGSAAMYCDAYSIEDISNKVARMMADPVLRASHRALGFEHASRYRWEASARTLLELLHGKVPV